VEKIGSVASRRHTPQFHQQCGGGGGGDGAAGGGGGAGGFHSPPHVSSLVSGDNAL